MVQHNGICDWNDWQNNLTEEQRQYEIWRLLSRLSNRRKTDSLMSFLGGFVGGVTMVGILGVARFFI